MRRLPPSAPLLAGLALLVLVAVLSATGESAVEVGEGWVPRPDRETGQTETALPEPSGEGYETPPVLRAAAAVSLMALLAVLALLFLLGLVAILLGARVDRRPRRAKLEPIVPVQAADDVGRVDVDLLRRGAGGALQRLDAEAGGDPGDAVVRAWLTLEASAAGSGLARQPHQTPTEFASAVLAGLDVDADALDRLRRLYQRARFSGHQVTDDDVAAARAALHRVCADLDALGAAPGSPA